MQAGSTAGARASATGADGGDRDRFVAPTRGIRPAPISSAQRLGLVHRVAEALAAADSTEAVLSAVVRSAEEVLGASAVSLGVTDADATTLTTLVSRGFSKKSSALASQPVALDDSTPAADVLRRREPLLWSSLEDRNGAYPRFAGFASEHQSWALLPLASGGRAFGILVLGWHERRRFTRADAALLEVIAHQCAVALDRARLVEALEAERSALELLAEGTRIMVSALEPSEIVRSLVRLAVPALVPWCAVYVADGRVLRRAAIEIAGHPELADRLRGEEAVSLDADQPLAEAYRTSELQVVEEVSPALVEALYPGEGVAAFVRRDGRPWTAVVVPVQVSGQIIGVMSLVSPDWGGRLPDRARFAAEGLAARAGIALANAGRFQQEHEIALTLTRALLPAAVPEMPGYEVVARYLPSGGSVAGDWFDIVKLPNGSYLLGVGDVAGHGIQTAATMAQLRNAARGLAFNDLAPAEMLQRLSLLLCECEPDGFATAVYGLLDAGAGALTWSAAGHLPFIHYGAGGARLVPVHGSAPLGWLMDSTRTSETLQLDPGDGIVLFTDGVIERRAADLDDRLEVLRALVEANRSAPVETIVNQVVDVLCARAEDDCCVAVLRRAPA